MQELLVDCGSLKEGKETLRCRYSVLVDPLPVGRFFCEQYGVKIVEEGSGEMAAFPALTCSAAEIDLLMEKLVRNRVTPTGLADVLCDWKNKI